MVGKEAYVNSIYGEIGLLTIERAGSQGQQHKLEATEIAPKLLNRLDCCTCGRLLRQDNAEGFIQDGTLVLGGVEESGLS